jgi:excinuclease ABC subunit C
VSPEEFKVIQATIPHQPGVYKYYDKEENLLYVGKAKDLRKRVSSYWRPRYESNRIRLLVKKISRIEYTIVTTERDALLLEDSLIKEFQPRYNIQLKDDKSFPYLVIKNEPYPRIFMTRKLIRDGSEYLGPYTSVKRIRSIVEFIRTIYPIRTCNLALNEKNISEGKFKVCLEYHMGNCLAPCEGMQSEAEYAANIAQIRHIMKGNFAPVKSALKTCIAELSEKLEFEKAEEFRQKLKTVEEYQVKTTIVNQSINNVDVFSVAHTEDTAWISYLRVMNGTIIQTRSVEVTRKLEETKEELLSYAIIRLRSESKSDSNEIILPFVVQLPYSEIGEEIKITIPQRGDKKNLVELAYRNALYQKTERLTKTEKQESRNQRIKVLEIIQKDFRLTELPVHIECFDNSNLGGTHPVASCVVFKYGKPSKSDYRHYHIKTVVGPDDFASMKEVIGRRYKRLVEEKQDLPQLVVVDGGKGQLSAAVSALEELGIRDRIPIVGIAKKLEEIFYPDDPLPLYIDKRSPSLKVIQQLRNEAHRFAITFHRNLRSGAAITSELTTIPGIGKKSMEALLKHFKSTQKVRKATSREIAGVIGESKARLVRTYFEMEEAKTSGAISDNITSEDKTDTQNTD